MSNNFTEYLKRSIHHMVIKTLKNYISVTEYFEFYRSCTTWFEDFYMVWIFIKSKKIRSMLLKPTQDKYRHFMNRKNHSSMKQTAQCRLKQKYNSLLEGSKIIKFLRWRSFSKVKFDSKVSRLVFRFYIEFHNTLQVHERLFVKYWCF